MSKPKSTAPRWGLHINSKVFELMPEESAILNEHAELWKSHCDSCERTGPHDLADRWHDLNNMARHGDEKALAEIERYGSESNFVRVRRLANEGKTARFHRENAPRFAELRPIAKRLRAEFEKLRSDYRNAVARLRDGLGLKQCDDDFTGTCDRLISDLLKIESASPTEFMQMHDMLLEVQPIED